MIDDAGFNPPADPWDLFRLWMAEAEKTEPNDPNAMALATVGPDGTPSVRIMLMKGYGPEGITFYTNRQSRKGGQMADDPRAGVCFHWKLLRRQIRAEGPVTPVSDAESDAYFATRPRGSQIGAWASRQSQTLEGGRATLEERVREAERQYEGKPIPRPPHWGGYRLVPLFFEFWQDQKFRLHDRAVYRRASDAQAWTMERQYP